MQQIPNPMANLYQSQLEASRRFADAVFSGTEKLDHLMLEAARHAVSEQLRLAQVLAAGGNPADPGLAENLLQRNSGEAMNYQAEIMRVVVEMQTEIGQSMQHYIGQVGTRPGRTRESETAKAMASGAGDAMLNPMTSMLSMWETAFKEATAMATRNMAAARSNAQRVTETAGSFARGATGAAQHTAEHGAETTRKAAESGDGSGSSRRR